jgi:hypothetical protein
MNHDRLTSPDFTVRQLRRAGAEEVLYRPSGGTARKVWAIVRRFPPGAVSPNGVPSPKVQITAVADAQLGITPDRLNAEGSDAVEVRYPSASSEPVSLGLHLPGDREHESAGLARYDAK